MRTFWYRGVPNFGDQLTPFLMSKFGVRHYWTKPEVAQLFAVGSILQRIPRRFGGWIWGTGKMKAESVVDLSKAKVLALRGPLTGDAELHADPGLLAGQFAPEIEKRYPVGVLSHYIEPLPHEGHRIDVQSGVENVIAEAAQCERIITSSLHGLILADSLGIQNKWIYSSKVIGEGFKFRDYAASFSETIESDTWRLAPQEQVAEKQKALVERLVPLRRK